MRSMRMSRSGKSRSDRLKALAAAIIPFALCLIVMAEAGAEDAPSHNLRVGGQIRTRYEYWDYFNLRAPQRDHDYDTAGGWLRSRLEYTYTPLFTFFIEGQFAQGLLLESVTGGPGALYFGQSGQDENPVALDVRQAYLKLSPSDGVSLKLGRQDIKLGDQVLYGDGSFDWIKKARLSERLVGTVGWSYVERSNDGAALTLDRDSYNLFSFVAYPTTGVFDFDDAYETQEDIIYGGADLTIKRGTVVRDTELRLFGLFYNDDRDVTRNLAGDDLNIGTMGGSLVGVYPKGSGQWDLMLWGALQFGDFGIRDHLAGASLIEGGYRFKEVSWKPWIRAGLAYGSGDSDPTDNDHGTFFNILPTNHKYYGFMDQLALQNLINPFIQLRAQPTKKLNLQVDLHQFFLARKEDAWFGGSGAFNEQAFGYAAVISNPGETDVGREIDVTLDYNLHKWVTLTMGYSRFFGGDVVEKRFPDESDASFFYLMTTSNF